MANFTVGVPQGLVLGSSMFLLVTNDMTSLKFYGNMCFYANNT